MSALVLTLPSGVIVRDGTFQRYYGRTWWSGLKLLKVEVVDAENAARICRRTMKPWAILQHVDGRDVEAVSYPFVENGVPRLMVRTEIGEPGSIVAIDCTELRPIEFEPRVTGVPANDPLPEAVEQLARMAS